MRWCRRKQRERDIERELRSHLELEAEAREQDGLSPQEAEYAARRVFGNTTLVKEVTRDMWVWRSWEQFRQDVSYALRTMRRSPVVAIVAVLSLVLGIGVNTAIFSLIDAVMLKTLPVERPEELVLIGDGVSSGSTDDEPSGKSVLFSHPVYKEMQSRNQVFSDMLAFVSYANRMFVNIDRGEPELATPKLVSGNYFSVLGVPALLGRTFRPEDDRPGAPPVAVLSYSWWARRFGRDASVIGRTLVIRKTAQEGAVVQIIGVAPRDFFGEKVGALPEFWIPLSCEAMLPSSGGSWLNDRSLSCLQMLGRLKPGVREENARTNIDVLFRQILTEYAGPQPAGARRGEIARTYADMHPASRGISGLRTRYSEPLAFLLALTGAVLAITCANIASLLLARATARQKEMSVRVAIGAGRLRLIRQMLTESVVLATAGGALGLLFGWWARNMLLRVVSGTSAPTLPTGLDLRMLCFTALVSLSTGLLFGLAPALRATSVEVQPALKEASASAGGRQQLRLSHLLVTAQVAMTLLLLVAAGAFVRSLRNLRTMDAGFDKANVLMFELDAGQTGYNATQLTSLYDRLLERIGGLPGVQSASFSRVAYSRGIWGDAIRIPGERQGHIIRGNFVTPRYLETMGITLRAGRSFGHQDRGTAPKVAMVNETLARRFFPGRSPLGERFSLGDARAAEVTIVGVVRDFKYNHVREDTPPLAFFSSAQFPGRLPHLAVRTSASTAAITAEVRQTIQQVAGSLPVVTITPLSELVDRTLTTEALVAELATFFGLLATVLACIGIYGILSYAVAARINEIGIRLAIGARPRQVYWIVLRDMLRVVAAGIFIGVVTAAAIERLVKNMLFGLKGTDPMTVVGACLVLLTVATAAAYIPARRASRVDPLVALRYE